MAETVENQTIPIWKSFGILLNHCNSSLKTNKCIPDMIYPFLFVLMWSTRLNCEYIEKQKDLSKFSNEKKKAKRPLFSLETFH